MTRVRLLHVSQPTTDGVGHCVRDLVSAGVSAGYDVTVACPEGPLSAWARGSGARWIRLDLARRPSLADVVHVRRLREIMAEYDVVHLHSSKAGAIGRLALMLTRPRPSCVFTPHGWSWLVGGRRAPAYRAIERALAPVADAIVAVSDEDLEMGRRVLGGRARLRKIANGVDTARFTPEGATAPRPRAPFIVCVGRLSEAKGQADAIAALSLLSTRGAIMRFVGDGEDEGMLRALADGLGVSRRVEFVGAVGDVAPHYRAADIVIVPSRWDAQSLVLLEAMACGRTIIATAVPGAAAVDGVGEVVPTRSPSALAAAIDILLSSQRRRIALGRDARRRAVEQFDLRRSTAQWERLWEEARRWR